jgi:hypothetical protein
MKPIPKVVGMIRQASGSFSGVTNVRTFSTVDGFSKRTPSTSLISEE